MHNYSGEVDTTKVRYAAMKTERSYPGPEQDDGRLLERELKRLHHAIERVGELELEMNILGDRLLGPLPPAVSGNGVNAPTPNGGVLWEISSAIDRLHERLGYAFDAQRRLTSI